MGLLVSEWEEPELIEEGGGEHLMPPDVPSREAAQRHQQHTWSPDTGDTNQPMLAQRDRTNAR